MTEITVIAEHEGAENYSVTLKVTDATSLDTLKSQVRRASHIHTCASIHTHYSWKRLLTCEQLESATETRKATVLLWTRKVCCLSYTSSLCCLSLGHNAVQRN